MPIPTRDEIKPKVIAKLKAITDEDDLVEKENSSLVRDLGMSDILKKAMAVPYSKISTAYGSGIKVTMTDAGKCETVGESVDLVFKRAKGEKK